MLLIGESMKEFKIVNVNTGEEDIAKHEFCGVFSRKSVFSNCNVIFYKTAGWKRAEPDFKVGDMVKIKEGTVIQLLEGRNMFSWYNLFKIKSIFGEGFKECQIHSEDEKIRIICLVDSLIKVERKEFKVGDRVKMKLADGNWVHGKILGPDLTWSVSASVVEWEDYGDKVLLSTALNSQLILDENPKPKFKIGDKVIMKHDSYATWCDSIILGEGRIFGITVGPPYFAHVQFDGATKEFPDGARYVKCEDLILVNQPKQESKMKLEIYEESKEKEPVRLKLQKSSAGEAIFLVAVDKDGDRLDHGNLLTILNDGHLYLNGSINPEIGLKLDHEGRLRVKE